MKQKPDVRVGQAWIDNDKRNPAPREIKVVSLDGDHAACDILGTYRRTKIRLDRFKPTATGYRIKAEA